MNDIGELHDLGIKASREAPLESFFKRKQEALRRIEDRKDT